MLLWEERKSKFCCQTQLSALFLSSTFNLSLCLWILEIKVVLDKTGSLYTYFSWKWVTVPGAEVVVRLRLKTKLPFFCVFLVFRSSWFLLATSRKHSYCKISFFFFLKCSGGLGKWVPSTFSELVQLSPKDVLDIFPPKRQSKKFHIMRSGNTVHVFFTVSTIWGNDLVWN